MARKSTGKRMRFEIFKRDGFRCFYCGATPVQKVLRVDHVVPAKEGGTDDATNLVTACFDCNAGKSAVPLDRHALKIGVPSEKQREHVEQIREYLELQKTIDDARADVVGALREAWEHFIGPLSDEMSRRFHALVRQWPQERLIEAIEIAGRRMGSPGAEFERKQAERQTKYFHGILKRWREEGGSTEAPVPPVEPPKPPLSGRARAVQQRLTALHSSGALPGIESVVRAFSLLAFGRPDDLSVGFESDYPGASVRGLLLVIQQAQEKGMWRWWVEDDPYWASDVDLEGAWAGGWRDVALALVGGDLKDARSAWGVLSLEMAESRAFCRYTRGESSSELRAVREELGWPNPELG